MGMTLDAAVDAVSRYMPVSGPTISRLEQHDSVPYGPRLSRARMTAYLLCLIYGLDPASFDLSSDDLPPGIRESVGRDLGLPSTRCYEPKRTMRLDGPQRATHRAPAA